MKMKQLNPIQIKFKMKKIKDTEKFSWTGLKEEEEN